jgi:hypothetical protein
LVQVTVEQVSAAEAPPLEANQSFNAFVFPLPHWIVRFEAWVLITGAVMSWILIVWVAVAVFPQTSVAVQVLVTEDEPRQAPGVVASSKVNVTVPAQLSVAVGVANTGAAGQSIVLAAGSALIVGATVSFTLIVCDTEDEFPQASVNVQVLTIMKELAQAPGVVTSTPCAVIAPWQLSVAVKVTLAGTSEPQATFTAAGAAGAVGATVSFTLIVCDTEDEFPQASVNVQVLTITKELAQAPGVVTSTPKAEIDPPQLSVAVSVTFAGTSVAQVIFTVAGAAGAVGATVSFTLIVCDTEDEFPQVSVNVQVLTITKELAQAPGVVTSTPKAEIAPVQASVAVSVTLAGTSVAQATFTVAGAVGTTGAVTSWIVMVCVAVAAFPHTSVAVQVLITVDEPAQAPGVVASRKVNVTFPPQASVAVGVAKAGTAGQLIVDGAGSGAITGGVVSWTIIDCVAVAKLPQASVAVHVLTTVYELAQAPGTVVSTNVGVTLPEQLSVAVGVAKFKVPPHAAVVIAGKAEITGEVVSDMVIVCVAETGVAQLFVIVKVLVIAIGQVPACVST